MLSIKNVFVCFSLLLLTACATLKDNFDCKYSKGVGCHSITEVNAMVNQGKLGGNSDEKTSATTLSPVILCPNSLNADSLAVERVTEEHLKLWIAPFQDKQGNFHEGAVVHTVLKPGLWHVKEGI